jgi:O-antigen/teichoic acid export membrane protein
MNIFRSGRLPGGGGWTGLLPAGARDAGMVFFGDVFSKFLTFLITLSMLALLTPDEYRLYGLFITVLAAVNQFTDSGLHQSFIRFYSLYRVDEPARARAHFRFALGAKIIIVITTAAILYVLGSFLAIDVLRAPELEAGLHIMALAVVGGGMMEFILAVLQARQEFKRFSVVRIAEAALKTGLIYGAIAFSFFSLTVVYASYAVAPLVVCAVAVFLVAMRSSRSEYHWRDIGREVFDFGKWMMITSFATMFLMRLDVFMITPMLADRPEEAGLYIAAAKLCTPLIVLAGSVSTVFFPRAMQLRTLDDMRRYVRRTFSLTLPVAGLGLIYLIAMYALVPVAFPAYTASMPLFAVLFFGYTWTIIGNPLTMLILSIGRERIATWIALGQLVLTLLSHYIFITVLGSMGAAISSVIIWFVAGSITLLFVYMHRHEVTDVVRRREQ